MFPRQCISLEKRWKLFNEAFVFFWGISANSHTGILCIFFFFVKQPLYYPQHSESAGERTKSSRQQECDTISSHAVLLLRLGRLDVILVAVHPTHAFLWAQKPCCCDALWARSLFMFRNGRVRAIDTHQHPAAYYFLPVLALHQALTWQVDGVHKEIMSWASFPGKLLTLFTNSGLQIERECGWEEVVKGCSGVVYFFFLKIDYSLTSLAAVQKYSPLDSAYLFKSRLWLNAL